MVDTGFGCQATLPSLEPLRSLAFHTEASLWASLVVALKEHDLLVGACLFFLVAAAGRAFPSPPPQLYKQSHIMPASIKEYGIRTML